MRICDSAQCLATQACPFSAIVFLPQVVDRSALEEEEEEVHGGEEEDEGQRAVDNDALVLS